ncbi:transposase, partial [Candidatus Sumerlaeota bacterium]|nr:transposase [Candidatus Sumerlaeota bacterium]
RVPLLDPAIREPLAAYLGGALRNLHSPSLAITCMADHVHILYSHHKNVAPIVVVEEVKRATSKWIKTQGPNYRKLYWQRGYGLFSVSASRLNAVTNYIRRQETHHQRMSFQDEYRAFLREYGISFDERFVWD